MRKTAVLISFILFVANAAAQDTLSSDNKFKHYVGFAGGTTTGYGMSYRMLCGKNGLQINAAPMSNKYNKNYNAGVTLLRCLNEEAKTKLFVYLSNSLLFNRSYNRYCYPPPCKSVTYDTYKYNTGLGLDFEFKMFRSVVFNLMGGIGAYNSFESINLAVEGGIHYKL